MPVVLITPEEMLHQKAPYVDLLKESGFEILYPEDPHFNRGLSTEEETIAQVDRADAILAGGEHFTQTVLENVSRIRVIARAGVGFDRIDLKAATAQGIPVTISLTANYEAVAEHTFALLLSVAKSILMHDRCARTTWKRNVTRPLRGRTLGVLGMGRIGKAVAIRAMAFGMEVIGTDIHPEMDFFQAHGIKQVDFQTLLKESDYLSVHCPLNEQTRGMLNRECFARMKPGSVLINTARGGIIAGQDLIEALKNGPLLAAGLDVCEVEPLPNESELTRLPNVTLTPHIAGEDDTSIERMGMEAAESIVQLWRGEWPESVLNQELGERWKPLPR